MKKEDMLKLRERIKAKKPDFIRQDAHKKVRLKKKWKRPKGFQSKIRLQKRGYRSRVACGYGSPSVVSGLDKTGLRIADVSALKDLDKLNPEEYGIIISGTVGLKKKLDIIRYALEKKIRLLNIKNPEKFMKNAEENISIRKKEKSKKLEAKEKKKKTEKEKGEEEKEKGKLSEKLTEEDKKEQEKKEKDKLLTKKDMNGGN